MSVRVVYRNNAFYYALMPGLWLSGILMFVWDVLFGTAHFSRRYPPAYGLTDDRTYGPERWLAQLVFPLVRSKRADSVLGAGRHMPQP